MVSTMSKMQRIRALLGIRALLADRGKDVRRGLLLVGVVVLAGVMPTAPRN